jgi:hypothetical protein
MTSTTFTTEPRYDDNESLPEVKWTRGERMPVKGMFEANGEDASGKRYAGFWHEKDGCISISVDIIDVDNYDGPGDQYYSELLNG